MACAGGVSASETGAGGLFLPARLVAAVATFSAFTSAGRGVLVRVGLRVVGSLLV